MILLSYNKEQRSTTRNLFPVREVIGGIQLTEEKSYTVKELSDILNVSDKTVRKLLNDGDLKGFKVGKNWRVKPSELEKYQNQDQN